MASNSTVTKPPQARGRPISSKHLAATSTASARAKKANKPPTKTPSLKSSESEHTPAVAKTTRTPANARVPLVSDASTSKSTVKATPVKPDLSATPPSSDAKAAPPSILPTEQKVLAPTSDSLQVAAQLYPWLYMTSTLEACFQTAEEAAKNDLQERSLKLVEEESEIADHRDRFLAEKEIDFYDELASKTFINEAPSIMQAFLSHGDACARREAEALELVSQNVSESDEDETMQIFNEMLDDLENLHAKALELETSILKWTTADLDIASTDPSDDVSALSRILGVFSACLPVLRARISNLDIAQELIDGARENLSISLRMESLGLLN